MKTYPQRVTLLIPFLFVNRKMPFVFETARYESFFVTKQYSIHSIIALLTITIAVTVPCVLCSYQSCVIFSSWVFWRKIQQFIFSTVQLGWKQNLDELYFRNDWTLQLWHILVSDSNLFSPLQVLGHLRCLEVRPLIGLWSMTMNLNDMYFPKEIRTCSANVFVSKRRAEKSG